VTPEIVAAERAREVRDAVRAWRRGGFTTEACEAEALARYPDDRVRFGMGFRILSFIFAFIAGVALVGFSALFLATSGTGRFFFTFWAVVMTALTELQRGPGRRADAGAETATACLAVLFAICACFVGTDRTSEMLFRFIAASFFFCGVAAWRWGDRVFSLGTAVAGFGLLAQNDFGRISWVLAAIPLIVASLRAARARSLAPSHRHGAMIVGAIAVFALYFALHVFSWDERLVEGLHIFGSETPESAFSGPWRALCLASTALLPPALLLAGWRRREPLLLYAGLLLLGVSIATVRLYRQVMPLSLALILLGASLLLLVFAMRRWLRTGAGGERDGFTADPLLDNTNRTEAVRVAAAMASFTPAPRSDSGGGFVGGGGSFGGGGATGSF
jgi:uncharacterized membrane protein YgcG